MATHHIAPVNLGAGDGTSWQDAIELQTLLNNPPPGVSIQSGDELWLLGENNIWNAGGRYQLTATLSFNIPNIGVYGGFRGTETSLAQRNARITCNNTAFPNYFAYPSIIDGAVLGQTIIDVTASDCIIDGFLIENGGSTGIGSGGGLHASGGLNNLIFENIVFRNNYAADGGGMFLGHCEAVLKNIVFFQNDATGGGGLHLNDGNLQGGKIALINVLFVDNGATATEGGAIFIDNSNVEIINCTIADNHASINGSGIFLDGGSPTNIYNSIIYPDQIFMGGLVPTIDYCLVNQHLFPQNQGGIPNFPSAPIQNPNFVNPGALAWNYHLITTPATLRSPCINAGDNSFFPSPLPPPSNIALDLEGKPRFMGINMVIDMGAFEMP